MAVRFPDTDLSVTHVQGIEGLASIRGAWEGVVSQMPRRRFFHLWTWYDAYLRCIEPDPDRFVFFLFSRGDRPVAIFPLRWSSFAAAGFRLKALSFPVHDHVLLCDAVCAEDACRYPLLPLLGGYLKRQRISWDILVFRHLLEDAGVLEAVRADPPARYLLRSAGGCDFTATKKQTFDTFIAGLSKNFRRSLKRARQHLDELENVRFSFDDAESKPEERLDAFMDVEASGWKGSAGTGSAIRLHPELVEFYRDLTREFPSVGKVLINLLEAQGQCIAAQFCLQLDDTVYMLKVGYDEAYSRQAPGKLLVETFLRRCMEDPAIGSVNFVTDAPWHADWAPETYAKSICYVYNASPAGVIAHAFMKYYGTHIKRHLPKRLQERLEPKSEADRK